jgi:ketosteroid isomerase-like protein
MRIFLLLFLCIFVAVSGAQAQAAPVTQAPEPLPSVTLAPELDRVLRDYERAWIARDASALAALFTPDGFVLRPGHPPVRGRAEIQKSYQNAGGPLSLRALAVEQSGPIAYIIGAYGPKADAPDAGKFILALQRDAQGRWLIAADMDNDNQ